MAGGGLMQLVAYGAQDIYLGPQYEKKFIVRTRPYFYMEYLTPDFDTAFNSPTPSTVNTTDNTINYFNRLNGYFDYL